MFHLLPHSKRQRASAFSSSTDPSFRMIIEDVFTIVSRGTAVVGRIEHGILKVGDKVILKGQNAAVEVVVSAIEMYSKTLDTAQAGDKVGVVLGAVSKNDVRRGDVLTGSVEFAQES